jgi:stringent starvation protein B
MDPKAPEKKERLLQALEKGMAMIHLDARRPGVLVPDSLRPECHLRLNLSYRFDPPDLSVSDWGVRSTLSFSGKRFKVSVPWSALFAITSHVTREFWMYPDDMPPEVIQQSTEPAAAATHAPADPPTPAAAPRPEAVVPREPLREVPCEPKSSEPTDEPPKPKSRGHLRLVK